MNFGDRLKKLRESKNISQSKLADSIGVTRSAIGNYEQNLNLPNKDILVKIATVLDCSVDYLINNKPMEYTLLVNGDIEYIKYLFGKSFVEMTKEEKENTTSKIINLKTNLNNYINSLNEQIKSIENDNLLKIIKSDSIIKLKEEKKENEEQLQGLKKILKQLEE